MEKKRSLVDLLSKSWTAALGENYQLRLMGQMQSRKGECDYNTDCQCLGSKS